MLYRRHALDYIFVLGRLSLPDCLPFRSQKSIGFFTSPKLRSCPAVYMQERILFAARLVTLCCLIKDCLRPRRISVCSPLGGMFWRRGTPKLVGMGPIPRRGSIRYPHGYKAVLNRGILFLSAKKMLKNLHIWHNFCTFAAKLV